MTAHQYQRVDSDDVDDNEQGIHLTPQTPRNIPSSPPPSFHSRSPSPTEQQQQQQQPQHQWHRRHPSTNGQYSAVPNNDDVEQTLVDTFGADEDAEDDPHEPDDRQRLMRGDPSAPPSSSFASYAAAHDTAAALSGGSSSTQLQPNAESSFLDRMRGRNASIFSAFSRSPAGNIAGRVMGGGSTNDGVFANLSAKPERGNEREKAEDLPPTYEQAAADATPPYWETTIIAPGLTGDEVYVDGLPVGSIFSFLWNALISTSFQLVGFLLTYLLHTTHAAKNGSRAGLGLTLVQYGFYMKGTGGDDDADSMYDDSNSTGDGGSNGFAPPDPNSHTFDPSNVDASAAAAAASASASSHSSVTGDLSTTDMLSYILMIVGWFILIRAFSDYMKARKHEQLILASPERGLPVPIIAEGERSETVV
ncbi:hypothetical protein KEM54_006102 [Ascosphaera aggregata]|nr:hypothetical protein KEM54_006102 [Ascosphaera aggregata]